MNRDEKANTIRKLTHFSRLLSSQTQKGPSQWRSFSGGFSYFLAAKSQVFRSAS
jgi:hypothetical protein